MEYVNLRIQKIEKKMFDCSPVDYERRQELLPVIDIPENEANKNNFLQNWIVLKYQVLSGSHVCSHMLYSLIMSDMSDVFSRAISRCSRRREQLRAMDSTSGRPKEDISGKRNEKIIHDDFLAKVLVTGVPV